MNRVGVLDYGMGNIGSIVNMIKKLGKESVILSSPDDQIPVDRLILPGVGAFDDAMRLLEHKGWIDFLSREVLDRGLPILGICLGMQLLCNNSEEGVEPGLGWINAGVVRFRHTKDAKIKIPHMGWNDVQPAKTSCLFSSPSHDYRFYFVHSYHVVCNDYSNVVATSFYGSEFVSAINRENIYGVQFHPEKSHRFGKSLLNQFLDV